MRDRDVRFALLSVLHAAHPGDDTKIVQEMGVWGDSARIDVAVINGEMVGYELKSDRDTLERLPRQADIYSRVFDRLHLVVGQRHADKAVQLIPEWWGVVVAVPGESGDVTLDEARKGAVNPAPDPYLVAELLNKPEAVELLEVFDLAKGWRSKRIKDIHLRLAAELPFSELAANVRAILKRRQGWLGQ